MSRDDKEVPDPTPLEVPGEHLPLPSLEERLKAFVRQELSAAAAAQAQDTFDEFDDFDEIDDEGDLLSDYQVLHMARELELEFGGMTEPAHPPLGETPPESQEADSSLEDRVNGGPPQEAEGDDTHQ